MSLLYTILVRVAYSCIFVYIRVVCGCIHLGAYCRFGRCVSDTIPAGIVESWFPGSLPGQDTSTTGVPEVPGVQGVSLSGGCAVRLCWAELQNCGAGRCGSAGRRVQRDCGVVDFLTVHTPLRMSMSTLCLSHRACVDTVYTAQLHVSLQRPRPHFPFQCSVGKTPTLPTETLTTCDTCYQLLPCTLPYPPRLSQLPPST